MADASTNIANIASYRDALDRAEKAEGDTLAALIARAHRIGDEHQVKAGLAVAFERNDVKAINAHLEVVPSDEVDFQRLIELSAAQEVGAMVFAELNLSSPTPPMGLTVSDARRLLETDDDD